jgi:hypothetical protein
MKIYKLSVQTHMYRYYFFATKKEAEARRRELRSDTDEKVHDADIDELEFPANRKGVAELLNDFVAQTCMNEG